ncbi:MAG: hypothetical protein ACLFR2_12415 [Candidatus Kapaibacterium sp.]
MKNQGDNSFFKRIFTLLFIIALMPGISGGVELKFGGYLHNTAAYQKSQGDSFFGQEEDSFLMDIFRARFRPELKLSSNSRITAHYEINLFAADVPPVFFNTGRTNRQAVNLNWEIASGGDYKAWHYFDMLYYKHMFDFGEITAGRQVISWGTGRVWQPMDVFLPINPANFAKIERDGSDAVSFKYYLGLFSDIEIVFNYAKSTIESGEKYYNAAARYRTNFKEFDLSLMSGFFENDKMHLGGGFTGNLYDAGIRGEVLYTRAMEEDDSALIPDVLKSRDDLRFIIGIDNQFTSKLYGLAEYQFNGPGADDKKNYVYLFPRLVEGELQNVGVHYIALQANLQAHPLVGLSAMNISNLGDRSGFFMLNGDYNMYSDLNISAGIMLIYGSPGSEYSYYPHAAFLQANYYF